MPRGKPLPVLFLTVFLDLLGFGIVIPLLPFVAQDTGANGLMVTLLMASYSLMQFLMAPVWGRLSDRMGRRPVLMASIGGSILGLVLFAVSESYLSLLLARVVHGAANGNIAVAQAYVADVTTPQDRARGMGILGAAFGLGFVFGPAAGGLLGAHGLMVAGLAAAGLALVNLVLAFFLLPESRPPAKARPHALDPSRRPWRLVDAGALRQAARTGNLGVYVLVGFLVTVGFSAMESTFALWSHAALGWGSWENGWLFTYVGVLIVLVQAGLIRPLRKRFGERPLAVAGLAGLALGLGVLPFAAGLGLLLLATGILAVANGVLQPNLSALVSLEGRAEEKGSMLGVYQGVGALGRVVGPILAGVTFTYVGIAVPFAVGAALAALACVVLLRASSREERNASSVTAP